MPGTKEINSNLLVEGNITANIPFANNTSILGYNISTKQFSYITNTNFLTQNGIWTSANFNPDTKVNALENARDIGFSFGDVNQRPYIYHATGGYVFLATQNWANSRFLLSSTYNSALPTFFKSNTNSGLYNQSNTLFNQSWFDYNWAGQSNKTGVVSSFIGLTNAYRLEIFGKYNEGGNEFGLRTRNGDNNTWNPVRWIWHNGNLDINTVGHSTQLVSSISNITDTITKYSDITYHIESIEDGSTFPGTELGKSGQRVLLHYYGKDGVKLFIKRVSDVQGQVYSDQSITLLKGAYYEFINLSIHWALIRYNIQQNNLW